MAGEGERDHDFQELMELAHGFMASQVNADLVPDPTSDPVPKPVPDPDPDHHP